MKAKSEEVYVALLRGVNVGGKNKIAMKALGAICEGHGCNGVKTYIQSGNVVFRASAKVAAAFPAKLKAQIKNDLGFETAAVMRSASDLRATVENNPFLKKGVDVKFLHVLFLADEPNLTDVVKLDPACVGDEAFTLRGREIFLYLPEGAGRSKLASYAFDKKLRTTATTRNWQTVNKLLALAEECSQAA
jgi:uncharacterized protein (DUF1697 family)